MHNIYNACYYVKTAALARNRPRTYVFGSCAHVHAPMLLKFFLWLDIWLMSILSFHDQSLKCILL